MSNSFKTAKGTELPLLVLKGKDYLQVAHRLVWFREERPTWSIETEFVTLTEKLAIAKATIRDESGRIVAVSHKHENPQGFPDFIEKSETGAIGRALALCGYGTQFTDDLDEGERLADSPVIRHGRGVAPEQPTALDGNREPLYYKVSFGKWAQRSLEEIYKNHGPQEIANYIDYLESSAEKKKQPITGVVKEFITNASTFLVAMERTTS